MSEYDRLKAQKDAIRDREAGWQPIDTAPKDGSRFMAFERGDEAQFYPCWWHIEVNDWAGWQNVWDSEPEPTHWMPLPSPPSTGSTKEQE